MLNHCYCSRSKTLHCSMYNIDICTVLIIIICLHFTWPCCVWWAMGFFFLNNIDCVIWHNTKCSRSLDLNIWQIALYTELWVSQLYLTCFFLAIKHEMNSLMECRSKRYLKSVFTKHAKLKRKIIRHSIKFNYLLQK